ncbi:hypothetical protein Hanom_Chr12g01124591 [Helianthus anomalus]
MTNISLFYVDYYVVFYYHSSTLVCLKFLCTVWVLILCFSDPHSVICGIWVCFMVEIMVFYDFIHFVEKMDFVAEPHPNTPNCLNARIYEIQNKSYNLSFFTLNV